MPAEIVIQPLTSSDRDDVLEIDQSAFGFDGRDLDPEGDTAVIEWDRAFGARHDDALGGIYVVFSFGIGVPARAPDRASVIPAAGLSWVAVHPDHRRQGLLTAMMRHHLRDVHDGGRGEAVSCLFASEASIYGRFGYGLATQSQRLTLSTGAALRQPRDLGRVTTRFEAARADVHDAIVKQVYDGECLLRPGHTARPAAHWRRHLEDPVSRRPGGAEALKVLIAERDGLPTGYAVVRRVASWGEHSPEGKLQVHDLQALDPQSAFALCRRLLDFDLMAEVTTPGLPLDHPLIVWAGEAGVSVRPGHSLWTRLVDVGPALAARGYAGDLDVVLDVSDEHCPWNVGRWRLAVGADGAECERTDAAPDLALDVRELGSVYLGGITLASLSDSGLVDEITPGAVDACSHAFRSALLPATPYMF